jgi:hypothetical protein
MLNEGSFGSVGICYESPDELRNPLSVLVVFVCVQVDCSEPLRAFEKFFLEAHPNVKARMRLLSAYVLVVERSSELSKIGVCRQIGRMFKSLAE